MPGSGELSQLDGLMGGGSSLDGLGGLDALAGVGNGLATFAGGLEGLDGLGEDDPAAADDPIAALDLDYEAMTNEEVAVKETSAVLEAFKARAKAEQDRFTLATDSEYWVGLCFQTREQKLAFLAATGLLQHGDKYIDGQHLAKVMGVALPSADVPYNVSAKVDAKFAAMVKDL